MVASLDTKGKSRVILKMTVQIPDGRKGTIHVFPDDQPSELAEKFCKKYELSDPKMLQLVEKHIVDNINALRPSSNSRQSSFARAAPPAGAAVAAGAHRSAAPACTPSTGMNGSAASAPQAALGESAGQAKQSTSPPPDGDPFEADPSTEPTKAISMDTARGWIVRWRTRLDDRATLRLCWHALQAYVSWERELAEQRSTIAAHEETIAGQELKMADLHEANSRIAVLAFSQAGLSPEDAAEQLQAILKPDATTTDAAGGASAASAQQLQAAEERCERLAAAYARANARRHDQELVLLGLSSWRGYVIEKRAEAGAEREAEEATANEAQAEAGEALSGAAHAASAAAASGAVGGGHTPAVTEERLLEQQLALESAQKEIETLRAELARKSDEVEEMTDMLIEAKLSQAELNGIVLGTKHELRLAEIKVHEITVQTEALAISPRKRGKKDGLPRRDSFPRAGRQRRTPGSPELAPVPASPSTSPRKKTRARSFATTGGRGTRT